MSKMATEESELFLGTLMEYSSFQLSELEARLDAEEMERNQLRESLSSLEFHHKLPQSPLELEEKCEEIVALGRASVSERAPSAEARTQQHDHQPTSPSPSSSRGIIRLIRLLAEIFVLLVVGISVLNGEFTSTQPIDFLSQQATQQNRPFANVLPSQSCCPEQTVQPSCYVLEIWDVREMNPCTSEQEEESSSQPMENESDTDDDQPEQFDEQTDEWQRQNDVSTFQVILSTATGQVHHFAFAFVNFPLVHGCALRRLRV